MTIQEFHINFGIEYDKTADFEYPYMSPEQIDYWLNKAQDRIVEEIAYPKTPTDGYEQNQNRVDELKAITKKSGVLTPTLLDNIYTVSLPTDYRHLVRHQCITNGNDTCGNKNVGGEQVTHEYINQMLKDPFWWPTTEEPLYYFLGDNIVYETKGNYSLISTTISYIKNPIAMRYGTQYTVPTTDVNTDMAEILHQRILDTAISMALENIESSRYQTNLNELSKTQ